MQTITLVTGNQQKLRGAQSACQPYGITVQQAALDIPEIQSEDGETIIRDKANRAFAILQKPLIVNDDIWEVPGLNGFPGPYMKSINHWFSPEDWLRLTSHLEDRRVYLHQYVIYQDADGQHLFTATIDGTILREARGEASNHNDTIISFNDQGLSNAEVRMSGKSSIEHRHNVWQDVAKWLSNTDKE